MTEMLTAGQVDDHLRSLRGNWEYPPDTVDTFKVGGRETIVRGIAVAWLPFTWALQKAIELGCTLFVTHEPTFYDHHDDREELFSLEIVGERKRLLEDSGLAVLRCHDMWDRDPERGITTAWADFLGLSNLVDSDEYARLYEIEPVSAGEFAGHVAALTAELGQPGVHLVGDAGRDVSRVCVGTGAISPYLELVSRFSPDLVVCSDDGMDYWRDGAFAVDGGPPIVVVHHGVTEEPGVANLAAELQSAFSDIPVHHIEQRCMYEFVPPPDSGKGMRQSKAGHTPGDEGGKR